MHEQVDDVPGFGDGARSGQFVLAHEVILAQK